MNLSFVSSKGGVGKSTACASLASLLAMRGDSVLIIDLDQNNTLTRWSQKIEIPSLTVKAVDKKEFSDFYRSGEVDNYDHVFMDLAGVKEAGLLIQAIGRANLVIIPAQHSEPDLNEAMVIVNDLRNIEESFDREIPYRLLFNRCRPLGSKVDRFIMDQVREHEVQYFETMLIDRVAYREMLLNGVPPHVKEPKKGAGPEVSGLMEEIETILGVEKNEAPKKTKRKAG